MKLWWLSFASSEGPFLGASIVKATRFDEAINVAWHLGCNPGGEVKGFIETILDKDRCKEVDKLLGGPGEVVRT